MKKRPDGIAVGVSARHVHLSAAHVAALFGKEHSLRPLCVLSQPHEHGCLETVRVRGPSGALDDVRVIGPAADQTSVELPLRDCERIGAGVTLRLTRLLEGSDGCVLEGPAGTVVLGEGVVNAVRHLRVPPAFAKAEGLSHDSRVSVRVAGDRARVVHDVVISVEPGAMPELVLDLEEAAAVDLGPDTVAQLNVVSPE